MELRFVKKYLNGYVIYDLKVDNPKEFKKLHARLNAKYYKDSIDGYSFAPIYLTPISYEEGAYRLDPAAHVTPFDITEEDIKELVERLKECKEELNEKEVLVFNI